MTTKTILFKTQRIKMTYQLIPFENHYIGVSDEFDFENKNKSQYGYGTNGIILCTTKLDFINNKKLFCTSSKSQAIELGIFYFELEDEVEKLAIEYFDDDEYHRQKDSGYNKIPSLKANFIREFTPIFKAGYNANPKKFTEEDMRKCFEAGRNRGSWNSHGYAKLPPDNEEFIQSLQPSIPKSLEVVYANKDNKNSQDIIFELEPTHTTTNNLKTLTKFKINY